MFTIKGEELNLNRSSKKKNQINMTPILGSKSKIIQNNITPNDCNDDERNYPDLLRLKLTIQHNILKLYESWVNVLLSIINEKNSNKNHFNLGTPIQTNLLQIENYQYDNYRIKVKISEEISKNNKLSRKLTELKTTQKCYKIDEEKSTLRQVKLEKRQLMLNIQEIADELDQQSKKSKNMKDRLSTPEYTTYLNAIKELNNLKEENSLLKEICELGNQSRQLLLPNYKDKKKKIENDMITVHSSISSNKNMRISMKEEDTLSFAFGLLSCV